MRYKIVMWYSAVKYHLKARNKYARVRSDSLDDEMNAMNCNETMSQALRAPAILIEESGDHIPALNR
jgi:hypothetical protein